MAILRVSILEILEENLAEILHGASLVPKKTPCKNSAHLHRKKSLFTTGENRDFRPFRYLPRIFGQI